MCKTPRTSKSDATDAAEDADEEAVSAEESDASFALSNDADSQSSEVEEDEPIRGASSVKRRPQRALASGSPVKKPIVPNEDGAAENHLGQGSQRRGLSSVSS